MKMQNCTLALDLLGFRYGLDAMHTLEIIVCYAPSQLQSRWGEEAKSMSRGGGSWRGGRDVGRGCRSINYAACFGGQKGTDVAQRSTIWPTYRCDPKIS